MTHKTHSRKQRTRLDLRFDVATKIKRIWTPIHAPDKIYLPDSRHTTKRRGEGGHLTTNKRVARERMYRNA